ncbi:MAG: hypothetical protein ACRY3E_03425, partial [Candidatus Lariskella arthropodorum]
VIISPEWFDKLEQAKDEEEDMLDLAFGLTKTSRLGYCQYLLSSQTNYTITNSLLLRKSCK